MDYSVIIPHRNSLDLLTKAVNSIPEDERIEIIVVDNSTKPIDFSSLEKKSNVQILFSPTSKGAGGARNMGLHHATGKWILFLDADDFFPDNVFDKLYPYVETDYDIIFGRGTSVGETDRHSLTMENIDDYFKTNNEDKLRYCWDSPWGKVYSSKFLKEHEIQFDEISAGNDIMFSVKAGHSASSIYVIQEILYCITIQEKSITSTHSLENIESRFKVKVRYNKYLSSINKKEYRQSVIFLLFSSLKYGLRPFFRLLSYSIHNKNNIFVGILRWPKTFFILMKNKLICKQ